jgi:flotillin
MGISLILGLLGLGTGSAWLVIKKLYHICQPSEVLIFAGGRQAVAGTDRTVGYRLVKGGSSIQVPLLEEVYRMELSNMIIELKVTSAFSKGGIPLNVEGVANIKVSGEEPTIHNAIERLLGKTRKEIEQLARETLEGNLRGVLASLTPEQVNEDKGAFARSLLEEAEDDLACLGLALDNLQIQNISDDVRYLDSLGRKQQAEVIRDSRIAEARAQAESIIRNSENEKLTALRRIERDRAIVQADAERRVRDAQTKRVAMVAEAQSIVGAEIAKTEAEVNVQRERIIQVERKLQADVIVPAEARCKQSIAQAKGGAAGIIEDGKAQAEGLRQLALSWQSAGPNAKQVFLLQKLDVLLKAMTDAIPEVDVQKVTMIDATGGTPATKSAAFLEQLKQTTGMDVPEVMQQVLRGSIGGATGTNGSSSL